jgi:hypothetical protein
MIGVINTVEVQTVQCHFPAKQKERYFRLFLRKWWESNHHRIYSIDKCMMWSIHEKQVGVVSSHSSIEKFCSQLKTQSLPVSNNEDHDEHFQSSLL